MLVVWTSTAIAVSCLAAVVGYLTSPSEHDHAIVALPTPRSTLPLLKNTLDLVVKQRLRIYDWLLEQCREHGGQPWRVRVLGRVPAVVLSSAEAMEDVLQTQFEVFGKGPFVATITQDLLGEGIFAMDGSKWKHQRKAASHFFTASMIRDAMEGAVREYSALLSAKLRVAAASGCTFDVKRLLDFFTMDVFAKIGFGVELNGLQSAKNLDFMDAFERSSRRIMQRFQQPMWVWKLARWLDVGAERQMTQDMALIDGVVYDVILRSMEEKKKREQDGSAAQPSTRKDLISLFLEKADIEYTPGEKPHMDPKMLRDMSMVFLFAGRDTTSLAMTWFLIEMNRNPRALALVRRELAEKLPHLNDKDDATPSLDDINELVYLEAAIHECIRLNPVVPAMQRVAMQDTTLYNGTPIKAGTRVILPHYAMGHLETVWGSDAEEFKPERWIDGDSGKLVHVSQFKFAAFLAGPRRCLGMRFALAEMKITLATILSKFEIQTIKSPSEFTYMPSMTLQVKGPVEVAITPVSAKGS